MTLAVVIACTFATPAMSNPTSPTGPTTNVGEPLTVKSCTVSASIYNRHVRKLNAIKGKKVRRGVHHRIACTKFRAVKRHIKRARADCRRSKRVVTASTFGTSAGDDNGVGYRGDSLFSFNDSFAELSNPGTLDFCALGCLPLHAVRYIHFRHRTERGVKRDVGQGGGGLGGTIRGIDLHAPLARRVGMGGLAVVTLTPMRCEGVF